MANLLMVLDGSRGSALKDGKHGASTTPPGHPRHWPRNSLFGTVLDPLHVILPPLGSASHNGVASRRDELAAGAISVPSSLCCRRTGNWRIHPRQAPGAPKALPSSSAARQLAIANSELEDANSKSPPSPSPSKAAAA
ncbi:hypothetical protein HaLaN_11567 [Haematococcus lacustris]|uniref:Uncharacterized protein n=1 Tax=Haematococcus lacustris TaxID=44745 RepID=A0A699YYH7_HAELA|nr:hypothetical protein HaLaN_11567 [Haematococcus lacustris]